MWASRDLNQSHQDRWLFRGAWKVLWAALQACPSNDSYDVFRGAQPDDTFLKVLVHGGPSASSLAYQVSLMPLAPYERERIDSVVGPRAPSRATTSFLWYGILEGATDASKLQSVAETLLKAVWPDKDAGALLVQIGHPRPFTDEEELRLRLRDLLFPGYNTLSSL